MLCSEKKQMLYWLAFPFSVFHDHFHLHTGYGFLRWTDCHSSGCFIGNNFWELTLGNRFSAIKTMKTFIFANKCWPFKKKGWKLENLSFGKPICSEHCAFTTPKMASFFWALWPTLLNLKVSSLLSGTQALQLPVSIFWTRTMSTLPLSWTGKAQSVAAAC